MRKVTLDYVAGFFDAHGVVGLSIARNSGCVLGFAPMVVLGFQVAMKDAHILKAIMDVIQVGGIHVKGGSEGFQLRVNALRDALWLIDLLMPKTLLKNRELSIAKEIISLKLNSTIPYSRKVTLRILELALELNSLHSYNLRARAARPKILALIHSLGNAH